MTLFHLCYVVKCAESLRRHYTYNIPTYSFNFHFPPPLDAFSDQRSESVGHQLYNQNYIITQFQTKEVRLLTHLLQL